jgi:6-phosphogluconolactonase
MIVRTLPSQTALAEAAAEYFVSTATAATRAHGRFLVALAGGSTPEALYRLLASPKHRSAVDWPRIEVYFGDERCVPLDSEDSNYRKARAALLDHVPLRRDKIHPMPGFFASQDGALLYEATLRGTFGPDTPWPRFDLVLLGMGDDGHTVSLFPGMPALDEDGRWVVGTDVPAYVKPNVPRITLTLPVLNAAYLVLFLVTGKNKAARVRDVLSGADTSLPAARVRPTNGTLVWLLDEEAASELDRR